jgi:hypothetical protein
LGRTGKPQEALAAIIEAEKELHSWRFSSESDGANGTVVRLPQGLIVTTTEDNAG